jgi:serine/threonine protein phosphatase PrpC
MSDYPIVQITAFTHKGRVRDGNEDSIAVDQWVRNRSMATPHQWQFAFESAVCCVAADGMGGHAAGEVASRHVASRLSEQSAALDGAEAVGTLLHEINAELYDVMRRDPSYAGMGSTVVGAIATQNRLVWFNVGDSRLYQYRNGYLRQISIDDVPDAAKGDGPNLKRRSGAITQSLGGTTEFQMPTPHVGMADLPVPSRWLFCTDGLTDMIDLDNMEACLASVDLQAASKLFQSAMQAGGDDNISIIILSFTSEETALVSGT